MSIINTIKSILHRSILTPISQSNEAGKHIGRTIGKWIDHNGVEAVSVYKLEGIPFGYSANGELLYPLKPPLQ